MGKKTFSGELMQGIEPFSLDAIKEHVKTLRTSYATLSSNLHPFCLGHRLCLQESPSPSAVIQAIFHKTSQKQSDHSVKTNAWKVLFYQNTPDYPTGHLYSVYKRGKLDAHLKKEGLEELFYVPRLWICSLSNQMLQHLHTDCHSPFNQHASQYPLAPMKNLIWIMPRFKLKKSQAISLQKDHLSHLAELVFFYRIHLPSSLKQLPDERVVIYPTEPYIKSWKVIDNKNLGTQFTSFLHHAIHRETMRYQQGFLRTALLKDSYKNVQIETAVTDFEFKSCLKGFAGIIKMLTLSSFILYALPKVMTQTPAPQRCILAVTLSCAVAALFIFSSYLREAWNIAQNWAWSQQGPAGHVKLRQLYPAG